MKYFLLVLAIILLSAGQLLLKKGVIDAPPQGTLQSVVTTLLNPYVIAGYFFYGVSSIVGLYVLKQLPISVAFPAMSTTYIIIVFTSALWFKEPLTSYKLIGVALILFGVSFLFRDGS
ncbi:hypothetical protein A3H80_04770 [Candidatus Roizmanbacteria bacterium RIFCSPLOWO2_02_FULL_37_19]|uniref:EamA domain-containing protein n=1 Tax=Candidatus Roizmanbacteria bacterium RIFCSPHIGHO2_02_FULL_37_24 TaxID=1802037 RepID=A0A1F7GXJ6_9BACT|nr:MAG: hypothetical protein A3C24_00965 [Candidatus Roizmanbacteria bacterium RIFCSPHIGHO2_02_FULL_37_24]OGK33298.1 MAG: hypothetical protein A3E10_00830 [Candidatus Roizmanbacteria bacterium RIFCSPHIGHO2_12_FULL_37_23]OGK45739.1 MAG: hypothetical protein A2956_03375 [Candidatus Roizmanbacteria bacterium RIFCSPLOWO2_01_FULL_37_57]OGK54793.1 MAG: hypothetical protein A3H80_04770 [Candidatus Roizmanbacteria bacterium RIFCSPLOWO2_02_FULL_37_19]OGK59501.1 MAG: hypothetical protein A3G65_00105 [Can